MDAVWAVLFLAAMGGLWWLAYRMDPHYSSKDGRRFLCHGQQLTHGLPDGRRKETRVTVHDDGTLVCTTKRFGRSTHDRWAIIGKSTTPPKSKDVYLVRQFDDDGWMDDQYALTIPSKSRVIPVLDEAMARRGNVSP